MRYYWTMRFVAWDVETWYAKATAALVAANGGESFSIYTNWNNVRRDFSLRYCVTMDSVLVVESVVV